MLKKRIIVGILSVTLITALTGCGAKTVAPTVIKSEDKITVEQTGVATITEGDTINTSIEGVNESSIGYVASGEDNEDIDELYNLKVAQDESWGAPFVAALRTATVDEFSAESYCKALEEQGIVATDIEYTGVAMDMFTESIETGAMAVHYKAVPDLMYIYMDMNLSMRIYLEMLYDGANETLSLANPATKQYIQAMDMTEADMEDLNLEPMREEVLACFYGTIEEISNGDFSDCAEDGITTVAGTECIYEKYYVNEDNEQDGSTDYLWTLYYDSNGVLFKFDLTWSNNETSIWLLTDANRDLMQLPADYEKLDIDYNEDKEAVEKFVETMIVFDEELSNSTSGYSENSDMYAEE